MNHKKLRNIFIGIIVALLIALIILIPESEGEVITKIDQQNVTVTFHNIPNQVLGTAFHITYSNGWQYESYELGSFFTQNSIPVALVKSDPQQNKLLVGLSLDRTKLLPTGSGEVITFKFSQTESSSQSLKAKLTEQTVRGVVNNKFKDLSVKWVP